MLIKSEFLQTLRNANVTPVHKKGFTKRNDEASYRPINNLSNFSDNTLIFCQNTNAVLEKILFHNLVF